MAQAFGSAVLGEEQDVARDARALLQGFMTQALWREKLMRDMLGPLHGRRICI